MFLRFLVLAAVALVLVSPMAVGQSAPTASLSLEGPAGSVSTDRATAIVPFTVTFRLGNVVCSESTNFPVTFEATASVADMAGMNHSSNATSSAIVTPSQLVFTVAQGPYGSNPALPAAQPYESSQTITVAVESPGLPNLTSVHLALKATLTPPSSGCQGTGTVSTQSATADVAVNFNNTATGPAPSPELPVPWQVVPLGLLAAAVAIRRRRAA